MGLVADPVPHHLRRVGHYEESGRIFAPHDPLDRCQFREGHHRIEDLLLAVRIGALPPQDSHSTTDLAENPAGDLLHWSEMIKTAFRWLRPVTTRSTIREEM